MAQQKKEAHSKPNREPVVPATGNDLPAALRLAVGDRVVYASHGIGRVESREHHRASGEMLVLVFENGLKVTLPLRRAQDALRSLSGESELEEVQRTLGGDSPPAALEHWSRRHRNARAKLVGGSVSGLYVPGWRLDRDHGNRRVGSLALARRPRSERTPMVITLGARRVLGIAYGDLLEVEIGLEAEAKRGRTANGSPFSAST